MRCKRPKTRRSSLSEVSRSRWSPVSVMCLFAFEWSFQLLICNSTAGASSSSSDSKVSTPSTTSDLTTMFSNNSTVLFHPDGERSPSSSDVTGSLTLPSIQRGGGSPSGAGASISVVSSTTSSSLLRPGDPGAPPLPDEVMVESPSNIDAGAQGCTSSGGDSNFQPLRSRSLDPTSHRGVF